MRWGDLPNPAPVGFTRRTLWWSVLPWLCWSHIVASIWCATAAYRWRVACQESPGSTGESSSSKVLNHGAAPPGQPSRRVGWVSTARPCHHPTRPLGCDSPRTAIDGEPDVLDSCSGCHPMVPSRLPRTTDKLCLVATVDEAPKDATRLIAPSY